VENAEVTWRQGHEQNRRHWNEIVERHFRHPDYKVKEFLNGRCTLKSLELDALGDVSGKDLLHLQCQFGLDTLSWVRRGAHAVGVDISERSIELADQLGKEAGLDAEFVCCDVLDLTGSIDRKFDIVFQSYGTYVWIGDLMKWAEVVAHHLKPGGVFYIVDGHPIAMLFLNPGENLSYFESNPRQYEGERDYCDRDFVPGEGSVEWVHTLSGLINSLIGVGLKIESFEEYNFAYYQMRENWRQVDDYWYPPEGPPTYPMTFSLKARKR
jgi:SAM-dependent methyltransferase